MNAAKKWTAVWIIGLIISILAPFCLAQQAEIKIRPSFKKEQVKIDGEEVTIVRDDFGVPHILASTERGAYFGGGYAVAQDRLFQLERFRRNALGRLAEIEGLQAYAADQNVRTLGYTDAQIQAQLEALPPEIKLAFQAYSDGINAYILKARQENKLPEAFKASGVLEPEPWKPSDSAAIAIMMAQRFGSVGGAETEKARVLKWLKEKYGKDGDAMFSDIFWLDDPKAYTTIAAEDTTAPKRDETRKQRGSQKPGFDKSKQSLKLERLSDDSLAVADDIAQQRPTFEYASRNNLPTHLGSYGFAVSAQRSVSGSAILVAGPQMGFTVPSIGYEFHYSAGEFNAIGMGIPGIPEVIIGHNDYCAWTATSGLTDMVDIFAEQLNPANKYQYMFKGQYRDMEKRVESIKVKDRSDPLKIDIYSTVHGPVVGWDESAGIAYSRAASYAGLELQDMIAAYRFSRAKNIEQMTRAAEVMATNRNYIGATVDGDIGFWHCGKPPVRAKGLDQRLPTPGTGEGEWEGLLPFSRMPQTINPKQGYIVNWNNKPAAWWRNEGDTFWGELDYATRIDELIRATDRLTLDQAREIAQDISTYDSVAHYLKPQILAALDSTGATTKDPRVRQAASYMRTWDNHVKDNSVGTTITRIALSLMRDAIFADEFDGLNKVFPFRFGGDTPLQHFVQMNLVLHALEGKKAALALSRDYLNGKNKDQFILENFNKSLDLSTSVAGPQMNLWKWPACYMNLGSLPGIPNTNRATYNQFTELSKPLIQAESLLPPGESEDARATHYSDQREMAGLWRFKDMLYKREQLGQQSLRERECGPNNR